MKNSETIITDHIIESSGDPFDLIQSETEKNIWLHVMSVRLTPDGLIIKETSTLKKEVSSSENTPEEKLAGVFFDGTQYFDLNGIHFINNTGIAILIDLLRSILELGVEVQFVNVDEEIKLKIKEMGLDNLINCREKTKIEKTVLL